MKKRIERAEKKETCWQILRECKRYLEENDKNWKTEDDKNCKEAKNIRLKRSEKQKADTLNRLTQKKITEKWNRLLAHEKRHLEQEETRRRRLELRDAKLNIWKKWRRKEMTPGKPQEDTDKEWLDRIEETLEKLKCEENSRKDTRRKYEERRKALKEEKKLKQEKYAGD